jgi:hypothetical protein
MQAVNMPTLMVVRLPATLPLPLVVSREFCAQLLDAIVAVTHELFLRGPGPRPGLNPPWRRGASGQQRNGKPDRQQYSAQNTSSWLCPHVPGENWPNRHGRSTQFAVCGVPEALSILFRVRPGWRVAAIQGPCPWT